MLLAHRTNREGCSSRSRLPERQHWPSNRGVEKISRRRRCPYRAPVHDPALSGAARTNRAIRQRGTACTKNVGPIPAGLNRLERFERLELALAHREKRKTKLSFKSHTRKDFSWPIYLELH